jgi:hypothetical protein
MGYTAEGVEKGSSPWAFAAHKGRRGIRNPVIVNVFKYFIAALTPYL